MDSCTYDGHRALNCLNQNDSVWYRSLHKEGTCQARLEAGKEVPRDLAQLGVPVVGGVCHVLYDLYRID